MRIWNGSRHQSNFDKAQHCAIHIVYFLSTSCTLLWSPYFVLCGSIVFHIYFYGNGIRSVWLHDAWYISYRFLQACIILHATSCGRPVLFDDSYSRVDSIIRDGSYHNKSRERDVSQMSIATIYVSRDNRYF